MSTQQTTSKPRKRVPRPELSIFEEELNVPFNKKEFLPDLPPHARDLPAPPTPVDPIQTVSKVVANHKQSDSKAPIKVVANDEQTVSKVVANSKSIDSQFLETVSATVSSSVSKVVANDEQTVSKVVANNAVSSLVGLQRSILFLIFNECQLNRAEISSPLSLEHIAAHCESTEKTVKNAIYRLIQKQFISRAHYKDGRGGWTQYRLSKTVFQDILHYETVSKVEANRKQTMSKVVAKVVAQPEAGFSSSSSILELKNFKTTTTEVEFDDENDQQFSVWNSVDPSPLAEVGFTQAHVIQLARDGKLSVEEVQDSIQFFAFDLKRNGKGKEIKGPPVSFFMGILRKGVPYAPPSNFESPEEAARRLYVESKRRLKERRESQEQEIKELEFSEWRNELTQEQVVTLVPEVLRNIPKAQESSLRSYFDDAVWPERAQDLLGLEKLDRAEINKQLDQALGETR